MSDAPTVRMRGIVKSFGSVQALRGADFTMRQGGVHAVLGENGAGKSTLMDVLFGLTAPDAGAVAIDGRPVRFRSTSDATAAGIGMVHQHFTQVAAMTVAENVALGLPGLRYDARAAAGRVRRVAAATGLDLDPGARASELSIALRQRLEIVKALARDVRILILDEPTGALAPGEVEELFVALRRLTDRGVAIVLITHKLREVAAIASTVTVLRRGETVLTGAATEFDTVELAAAMVGPGVADRELAEALEQVTVSRLAGEQAPVLDVQGVGAGPPAAPSLRDVSFTIGAGEVVGVAAVEGNGQRELLRAIAGFGPHSGTVTLRGGGVVGFIPEDRQREGLVLDFDIAENLALGLRQGFWLDRSFLEGLAAVAIDEYAIRTPSARVAAGRLSGGNQQKLVLARVLARRPSLIVAENPTRGLDLHATADVHERLLRAARRDGTAVLFHSSDLDEVLALADRVAVMTAGRWSWISEDERTRERVGALMAGAP